MDNYSKTELYLSLHNLIGLLGWVTMPVQGVLTNLLLAYLLLLPSLVYYFYLKPGDDRE